MIVNIINKAFFKPVYQMATSYVKLIHNQGINGDSLSKSSSSFEVFDFVEFAKQFRSSDFDVQSLLSVGAYDFLKPTYVSVGGSLDFADKFQSIELPKAELPDKIS